MSSDEGCRAILHPGGGAVYVIICNDTLLNKPWADEAAFCLSTWSSSSWDVSCLIVNVYIHKAASPLNICKRKATVIFILILKMRHVMTLKRNRSLEVKRQKKIITCSRLFTRLAAGLRFCFQSWQTADFWNKALRNPLFYSTCSAPNIWVTKWWIKHSAA